MLHLVAAVISLASMALGAPTVAPPTTCPGGVRNGETKETGRYWYTCQDGKLTMMGCLSDQRTRLTSGQTFKSHGYLFECTPTSTGEFTFTYKGCVSENGEEHMASDTWQDKNYWYTCTKTGDSFVAEVKGCIDDGKRYNPDERVKKSDLIYECKRYDTGNVGWNIYPNHAETVTYNPTLDHIQFQQTVPGL
jgi:hypothetical protein